MKDSSYTCYFKLSGLNYCELLRVKQQMETLWFKIGRGSFRVKETGIWVIKIQLQQKQGKFNFKQPWNRPAISFYYIYILIWFCKFNFAIYLCFESQCQSIPAWCKYPLLSCNAGLYKALIFLSINIPKLLVMVKSI